MTNSHEQCLMANNQPILSFLEFSDLIQFQAVFQAFGVDKFEHLKDVEVDDLRKFGLSDIEIRRYHRKKDEFESQNVEVVDESNFSDTPKELPQNTTRQGMGPLKPYKPTPAWKATSMGYVPNPTTPRSLFMNLLLPEFYNSKFKHCKNAKEFVKEFHGKGRELYHCKQMVDEIEKQINAIMKKENPASAGAVLLADYTLIPTDSIRINNNIDKAKEIMKKLSDTENKVKTLDGKLFSSTGKLKSGEEATHKFFETQFGQIKIIYNKVNEIVKQLVELKEKCARMFKATYSKPKSKKRKQKQNQRKAKKAKQNRLETNCKLIIASIAPNHDANDTDPIGALDLNYEVISSLTKKQVPYIHYAFNKGYFTKTAQDMITQYLKFDLKDIIHDDCSDSDDNNDCSDDGKEDSDDNDGDDEDDNDENRG